MYIFFGTSNVIGLLQMWPDLIQKAKLGGLDVIQTYVFWNGHEPSQGQVMLMNFSFSELLALTSKVLISLFCIEISVLF